MLLRFAVRPAPAQDAVQGLSFHLRRRAAEQLLAGAVHGPHEPGSIEGHDRVEHGVEDRLHALRVTVGDELLVTGQRARVRAAPLPDEKGGQHQDREIHHQQLDDRGPEARHHEAAIGAGHQPPVEVREIARHRAIGLFRSARLLDARFDAGRRHRRRARRRVGHRSRSRRRQRVLALGRGQVLHLVPFRTDQIGEGRGPEVRPVGEQRDHPLLGVGGRDQHRHAAREGGARDLQGDLVHAPPVRLGVEIRHPRPLALDQALDQLRVSRGRQRVARDRGERHALRAQHQQVIELEAFGGPRQLVVQRAAIGIAQAAFHGRAHPAGEPAVVGHVAELPLERAEELLDLVAALVRAAGQQLPALLHESALGALEDAEIQQHGAEQDQERHSHHDVPRLAAVVAAECEEEPGGAAGSRPVGPRLRRRCGRNLRPPGSCSGHAHGRAPRLTLCDRTNPARS